jgi:hypothetical protein
MRNHTGIRSWQLSGPNGEVATWNAGRTLRFLLNDVPELTSGSLCNHMLGILVTFIVELGADGVQTEPADADLFLQWLVDSVEVRNCWHGTPVSSNHAKGNMLGLMEFLSCGYQYFGRRVCTPTSGELDGQCIKVNTFIPLSYLMGEKGHHSALPVTMYRNAELVINCGTGSNDGPPETEDTFSAATVVASAVFLPESEIHLGAGQQFIDYQSPATASGQIVKLDSLGANTTLQNVEPGSGIDFLAWLSSQYDAYGITGSARVRDIREIGIPFRGMQTTRHLEPLLLGFEAAIGGRELGESDLWDGTAISARISNLSGFPYAANYAGQLIADMAADGSDIRDMKLFPIIYPGRDLELTKVQTFEGTQSYQLRFLGGVGHAPVDGTTHHTFAHQFFSWTPAAWDDALRTMVNSGVAQSVLGSSSPLVWSVKLAKKNAAPGLINPAKVRYLPQKLTLAQVVK